MGRKRVASAYVFGAKYKKLVDLRIHEDLADAPQSAYEVSPAVEDNGKLDPRRVYDNILDGVFSIANPEKTKTARVSVAGC